MKKGNLQKRWDEKNCQRLKKDNWEKHIYESLLDFEKLIRKEIVALLRRAIFVKTLEVVIHLNVWKSLEIFFIKIKVL